MLFAIVFIIFNICISIQIMLSSYLHEVVQEYNTSQDSKDHLYILVPQHSLPLTGHKGKQWVKVCCHDRAADPGRGTVLQHTPARREQSVRKGDSLAARRNFRNRNILNVAYRMCIKCHRFCITKFMNAGHYSVCIH